MTGSLETNDHQVEPYQRPLKKNFDANINNILNFVLSVKKLNRLIT